MPSGAWTGVASPSAGGPPVARGLVPRATPPCTHGVRWRQHPDARRAGQDQEEGRARASARVRAPCGRRGAAKEPHRPRCRPATSAASCPSSGAPITTLPAPMCRFTLCLASPVVCGAWWHALTRWAPLRRWTRGWRWRLCGATAPSQESLCASPLSRARSDGSTTRRRSSPFSWTGTRLRSTSWPSPATSAG